jgi:CRISPR-associated protein Cas1
MGNNMAELQTLSDYLSSLKTTVYLTSHTKSASLKNDNVILIVREDDTEQRLEIEKIRRLVIIGRAESVSSMVLYRLMTKKIPVDFLDVFCRPIGNLLPEEADLNSLCLAQEKLSISSKSLECAKQLIRTKLHNCKEILRRRLSMHSISPDWNLFDHMLKYAGNMRSLRGAEGLAARKYFEQWNETVKYFTWTGRSRHPALDEVNSVLSFGYTLLRNRISSALRAHGLNPRLGFYHMTRGSHCALASDLMEQFRPLVDTAVLSAIRRKTLTPDDFCKDAQDRIRFSSHSGFSKVLSLFEEMFNDQKTVYRCNESSQNKVTKSVNDLLDDCAENFALMLQDRVEYSTWRIGSGTVFSH